MAVALVLAACGGDDKEPVDPAAMTIHEVLEEARPPCPAGFVGNDTECLVVGPPLLDATAVAEAELTLGDLSNDDLEVRLELTEEGTAQFDTIAGRNVGKRLTILVDGKLASAPVVRQERFSGRITVSGLPREAAIDLARRLGGDTTVPTPTTAPPEQVRAEAACKAQGFDFGGPTTAGDVVTRVKRVTGGDAPPWDSLPPDHFVARCGRSDVATAPGCVPPVFLVDEAGRRTDDLVTAAMPRPTGCPSE